MICNVKTPAIKQKDLTCSDSLINDVLEAMGIKHGIRAYHAAEKPEQIQTYNEWEQLQPGIEWASIITNLAVKE